MKKNEKVGDEAVTFFVLYSTSRVLETDHRFTYLSEIAINFFGVPTSSANFERAFSTALDILSSDGDGLALNRFKTVRIRLRHFNKPVYLRLNWIPI